MHLPSNYNIQHSHKHSNQNRLMKLRISLALLLFLTIGLSAQSSRSNKRGVSENNFTYTEDVKALSAGCSWMYNWGVAPNPAVASVLGTSKSMEFVPMVWNGDYNEASLRSVYAANSGEKYLLGFNEPNFSSQANMTPAVAAARWHDVEALAKELGLSLVAPALNYSGETLSDGVCYSTPDKWMDAFIAAYKNLYGTAPTYDYLALHCYMDSPSSLIGYVEAFAKKYGKQVWLTEFCSWESKNLTPALQQSQMIGKLQMLEQSKYVFRYAWFIARGNDTYPYFGLVPIVSSASAAGNLTALGVAYVNMSTYDYAKYYSVDEKVAANSFVNEDHLTSIEKNTDSSDTLPVQVDFAPGTALSYQIDVPQVGDYYMNLRIATSDSTSVNVLDTAGVALANVKFSGTGGLSTWGFRSVALQLKAGKATIVVKSSGKASCKLAWLNVSTSAAGEIGKNVNEAVDTANVTISDGGLNSFDFAKSSNICPILLGNKTISQYGIASKIKLDLRDDGKNCVLYNWNGLNFGTSSGENSLGVEDTFMPVSVKTGAPWTGMGYMVTNKETVNLSDIDNSYHFHIALRSTTSQTMDFIFYDAAGNSTHMVIGNSAYVDGGKTYQPLTNFPRDGKWHHIDIPMRIMGNLGLTYASSSAFTKTYVMSILPGNASGTAFDLDAAFFYKPASSSVISAVADNACGLRIVASDGGFVADSGCNGIAAFSIAGILVAYTGGNHMEAGNLPSGIYIVKSVGQVKKILIK
jgi:hypothetical protein